MFDNFLCITSPGYNLGRTCVCYSFHIREVHVIHLCIMSIHMYFSLTILFYMYLISPVSSYDSPIPQPSGVKVEVKPSQIMRWGSRSSSESSSATPKLPSTSDALLNIEAKMVCSSLKQRVALTTRGTVYSVKSNFEGELTTEVRVEG